METCKAQLAQGASLIAGEPSAVRDELETFKAEVNAVWAQGIGGTTATAPRVEVLCREAYGGARKAREIENFLTGSSNTSMSLA